MSDCTLRLESVVRIDQTPAPQLLTVQYIKQEELQLISVERIDCDG